MFLWSLPQREVNCRVWLSFLRRFIPDFFHWVPKVIYNPIYTFENSHEVCCKCQPWYIWTIIQISTCYYKCIKKCTSEVHGCKMTDSRHLSRRFQVKCKYSVTCSNVITSLFNVLTQISASQLQKLSLTSQDVDLRMIHSYFTEYHSPYKSDIRSLRYRLISLGIQGSYIWIDNEQKKCQDISS